MPVFITRDTPYGKTVRVGVLSNPKSGRNRRGLQSVREILAQHPEVYHSEATTPTEVLAAVVELAQREVDVMAINGGDGTVASVLTALFNNKPFAKRPLLALLRGGTTNMTAGDVGLKGNHKKTLRKLLAWANKAYPDTPIINREVLRVQAAPDKAPIYGMFFGTGAIIKGIEYCHQKVHSKGFRDGVGPGLCTLRILLAMLKGDTRYVAPVPIAVEIEAPTRSSTARTQKLDHFLLLTSTLEHLFLGIRPYWATNAGALHYTAILAAPSHPLRAIPSLFWGRPNRFGTPENGYSSLKVNALRLTMDSQFTVDGELYEADSRAGSVQVARGGEVQFIRL